MSSGNHSKALRRRLERLEALLDIHSTMSYQEAAQRLDDEMARQGMTDYDEFMFTVEADPNAPQWLRLHAQAWRSIIDHFNLLPLE